MGRLTGTYHGDAASELMGFYAEKARELEEAGQYFMAAIALAFGIETAILAYLLAEFDDADAKIPDTVAFADLIDAANDVDILDAPIDIPSLVRDDGQKPKHVAKDIIDRIRTHRNLVHPALALRQQYDPRTFSKEDFDEFADMYESVMHSLLYYL